MAEYTPFLKLEKIPVGTRPWHEREYSNLEKIDSFLSKTRFEMPFSNESRVSVNHNLGFYPHVTILDNGLNVIIPDAITHISSDQLEITFSEPQSGLVICSR